MVEGDLFAIEPRLCEVAGIYSFVGFGRSPTDNEDQITFGIEFADCVGHGIKYPIRSTEPVEPHVILWCCIDVMQPMIEISYRPVHIDNRHLSMVDLREP